MQETGERNLSIPKPLTILMIVEASFAGVGRHTLDLAEQLIQQDNVVDLAYGSLRAEPGFLDRLNRIGLRRAISIDAPRSPGLGDIAVLRLLRKTVRHCGPYDIVHGHSSKGGAYARLLKVGNASVVYTPHALITQAPTLGRVTRSVYSMIERRLARRTDVLICVSKSEAAHARSLRLRPKQLRVVANGIPLTELPSQVLARTNLGLEANGTLIGFVGRLDSQKGLDVLLEAMPAILDAVPLAKLVVIGDGDLRRQLMQLTADLGLTETVLWLGRQPGQQAMPAFDVFALPSRYEAFPYVALESLLAGIPAVVTEQAGCADLYSDSQAGRIVARSTTELSAALIEVLNDPELRRAQAQAAKALSLKYSVEAMADQTRQAYGKGAAPTKEVVS